MSLRVCVGLSVGMVNDPQGQRPTVLRPRVLPFGGVLTEVPYSPEIIPA
ncbi:MAG: hypothetical protein WCA35_06095 [Kovacikia sp.]